MGKVLVIGGGVAGLQAATDLARLGSHEVFLLEKKPYVGGRLHDLERTYPTDDCSLCRLAPAGCYLCVKSPSPPAGFPGLHVLAGTEVVALELVETGESSRYRATVQKGQQSAEPLPVTFDAVILAPGCEDFDPTPMERLRYGRHPDVVTALQYEEMLARGRLHRPSDQRPIARVAWVQCVGARDSSLGRPLCSAVCCGYAIKEATVTRTVSGGSIQTTVFAQDVRTPGLALERYVRQAVAEHGVRIIHHRVHSVDVDEENQLRIRFADEGGTVSAEPFDLVVLSAAPQPDPDAGQLALSLGAELDAWGYCPDLPHTPGQTRRTGVFVAGFFSGPKDVSGSLVQASAAAAACAGFLRSRGPDASSDAAGPAVAGSPLASPAVVGAEAGEGQERVLVVGGGAAGLSCAWALARLGIPCALVERESSLGGQMLTSGTGALAPDLRRQLTELTERVREHALVRIHCSTRVAGARQMGPGWQVTLAPAAQNDRNLVPEAEGGQLLSCPAADGGQPLSCPAVVIATGGEAIPMGAMPADAHTGDAVLTLPQLEELVASGIPIGAGHASGPVVIVLCSGNEQPEYCSKVCCPQAVRCALALKSSRPDTDVLVLFRDMRTPGTAELEYEEARRRGVRFVRLPAGSPPLLAWQQDSGGNSRLALTYRDPILGEDVTLYPALVARASAIGPAAGVQDLAAILGIPLDRDGFICVRHAKVQPVEAPVAGIFACGSAIGPATVEEAFAQGAAAATRIATFLRERELPHRVADIAGPCSACLTCLRLCSENAIRLDANKPRIDPDYCRGCGICAAECPARAISLAWPATSELEAEVKAALEERNGSERAPLIVFACSHCASTAVERASISFPSHAGVIRVPCVGTVDEMLMLKAIAWGAGRLVLAGCGQCQYGSGPERARKRGQRVNELLAVAHGERAGYPVSVVQVTPEQVERLQETLEGVHNAD